MRKILLLFLVTILASCSSSVKKQDNLLEGNNTMEIIMTINDQDFVISLKQSDTTESLIKQLPIEMTIEDLNGNEKYYYTQSSFPTDTQSIGKIEAGDFMLFGDNCLVLFYESFTTFYSYTRLGKVKDVEGYLNVIKQSKHINVILHQ